MGWTIIRDHAMWATDIEGDPEMVRRILNLPQDAAITLIVDDKPALFVKMRDGADGRPTPGLMACERYEIVNALFTLRTARFSRCLSV